MDTELKAYLDAMEGRIGGRLDAMEGRIGGRLDTMGGRIGDRLEAMEGRMDALDAKIEKVETTLLTEFHKWASPTEARIRTHAATLRALDLEMEALSERVDKLEGPGAS